MRRGLPASHGARVNVVNVHHAAHGGGLMLLMSSTRSIGGVRRGVRVNVSNVLPWVIPWFMSVMPVLWALGRAERKDVHNGEQTVLFVGAGI